MSITRAQLKSDIYEKLMKAPGARGFYTDTKANSAIQEAMDYVATEMFLADEGWNHKIDYLDTVANVVKVDLLPHMSMVMEVRYLIGNTYMPLLYDQDYGNTQWSDNSGLVQFPARYRIIDNALYFNPAIGVGGANYLMIEYVAYPKKFLNDTDFMDSQFDRAMYWFMVYKTCSVLVSNVQQFNRPWAQEEQQWYQKALDIIVKRNQTSTPIGDFEGF